MKSFFWRTVICVVPVLLAAFVVGRAVQRYGEGQGGFNLGVDLVGGTILVYEIDLDRFPNGELPPNWDPQELAASLKRRIDPTDLYSITIRPVSNTRVEIILPTGGAHQARKDREAWDALLVAVREKFEIPEDKPIEIGMGNVAELAAWVQTEKPNLDKDEIGEFFKPYLDTGRRRSLTGERVQEIKDLISRQGALEFRILANSRDDADAIRVAEEEIKTALADPEKKAEFEAMAMTGKAPPAPVPPTPGGFNTPLGQYTYTWVELGRSERKSLGLSNKEGEAALPGSLWQRAAEGRAKGEAVRVPELGGGGGETGLLFSRAIPEARRLPDADKEKKFEYFVLTRDPESDAKAITGKYLTSATPDQDPQLRRAVTFRLDQQGGNLFYELTSKNAPEGGAESLFRRHLAIVLDGQIMSAPTLNAKISNSGQISGSFTEKEVDRLVSILRAGKLPATLKPLPVSENTIGATLGEDTVRSGTWAVLGAFVAVLLFMLVYYRFAGLVACIALLANLLLTIAFMVVVNATFTLPGLAGLVLMLALAVDANVLIYERIREERDRGSSLALALRNGYDRAFPTIIDTHLTSIFTAIVLYVVGNDQLKGFGISLTLGLLISLFTSLFMTRLIFDYSLSVGWLRHLTMMRFLTRTNINFMSIRYYWFTATVVLTVLGTAVFLARGKDGLNIDFNGGTAYGGRLKEMTDAGTLRQMLDTARQKDVLQVKEVEETPGSDGRSFRITYSDGVERQVSLPNSMTVEQVKEAAAILPDYSVEMIFVADPNLSSGDRTKLFNVRTSEKSPELVQATIDRLLGDALQRIMMKSTLLPGSKEGLAKTANLAFTNPDTGDPTPASPSQVNMLLERAFNERGGNVRFNLKGTGEEIEGRYAQMQLQLAREIPADDLKQVLDQVEAEFSKRPLPERLENFDSQLALETQQRALYAILASWGAILLYLWFRFGNWTFGLAAVLCLVHDLLFTMGLIAVCHYIYEGSPAFATLLGIQDFKIDLPAVAALLTLVGYSVNDTIVVFDRIREVRGKNPELTSKMINDSVNQTLSRTLLTSFITFLTVIVLYAVGGSGIHLFAFVMVVGVVVGTYSSIYIAAPLLLMFGEGSHPRGTRETASTQAVNTGAR